MPTLKDLSENTKQGAHPKVFPEEFTELLSRAPILEEELLRTKLHQFCSAKRAERSQLLHLEGALDADWHIHLINTLDQHVYPELCRKRGQHIQCASSNYGNYHTEKTTPHSRDFLCRNVDQKNDPEFYQLSERIGLVEMIQSKTLLRFVSHFSGDNFRLGTGTPFGQILCYEEGQYIGLHSDWTPELGDRGKFLVLHINLPNPSVKAQSLLYEENGLLNQQISTAHPAVTLFRPPFWHMTTPLQGADNARRWLIAICFRTN